MTPLRAWRFAIGDQVDHVEGGMRSIVIGRIHKGLGLYGVRAISLEDPQRDRMILASALFSVPAG